eukprot:CAMPEP_0172461764 /NCGR_PEP_ID=MMETSP1065-20121228/41662_1 /TAXON_ID=265537 /ORGANISM="Amphiprora paludosa, Strain CCMP125" /LENGTH=34 /DNA_ID= /DNA_START= /DNA_END= /DNA_ORIENTATION=
MELEGDTGTGLGGGDAYASASFTGATAESEWEDD